MPTYETLFITSPELTEDEESHTVESLAQVVSEGGGSFTVKERMGRRRLAYPIMKFADGVYVRFLYDSEAPVPKELERRLRLSDKVLRSLTVRLERDWAVEAKKQAIRDEQARVEAERVAALEAEERAKEEALRPQHASTPEEPGTGAAGRLHEDESDVDEEEED
jgi:small subunit ribosomal protein S6